MTFIRSISGFRGTIGGPKHDNLTPPDVVRSTVGYGSWILDGFTRGKGGRGPSSWSDGMPVPRATWSSGW